MSSYSTGIILAILSALCWGSLSVARKSLGAKMRTTSGVAWISFWQLPAVAALFGVGHLIFPTQQEGSLLGQVFPTFAWPPSEYWPWVAASLVINIAANWLMLRALTISPISLTAPYLAFTPVFTALLAIVVDSKIPGVLGWLGIFTVCGGAYFLNSSKGAQEKVNLFAPLKALASERGSLYALLVALLWSITPSIDRHAAALTNPIWHTGIIGLGLMVVFMGWAIGRDRGIKRLMTEFKSVPGWTVLASVLIITALTLQLLSYRSLPIPTVETIKRGLDVFVVMGAGYVMFGEKDIRRRLIAALVMVAGVAMTLYAG